MGQCGRDPMSNNLFIPGRVSFAHISDDISIDDICSAYYHTICLMKKTKNSRQRVFIFGSFTERAAIPIEICLPFDSIIYQISAGIQFACFSLINGQKLTMLKAKKDVQKWSQGGVEDNTNPVPFPDNTERSYCFYPSFQQEVNISSLVCGYYHTSILTSDGRVIFYGRNLLHRQNNKFDKKTHLEFLDVLRTQNDDYCCNLHFSLVASGHMKSIVVSSDLCEIRLLSIPCLFMLSNLQEFCTKCHFPFADVEIYFS
jgi:hypothetical protein